MPVLDQLRWSAMLGAADDARQEYQRQQARAESAARAEDLAHARAEHERLYAAQHGYTPRELTRVLAEREAARQTKISELVEELTRIAPDVAARGGLCPAARPAEPSIDAQLARARQTADAWLALRARLPGKYLTRAQLAARRGGAPVPADLGIAGRHAEVTRLSPAIGDF